jgi:superinfection exclusion protein B
MDLSHVVTWIRVKLKYQVILLLASSLVLFFPKLFPGLNLAELPAEYTVPISLVFIVSLSAIAVAVLSPLISYVRDKLVDLGNDLKTIAELEKRNEKAREAEIARKDKINLYLDDLSEGEKEILSYFVIKGTSKLELIPRLGHLDSLEREGILERRTRIPTTKQGHYQFEMPSWVFEKLTANPKKVLSDRDIERLREGNVPGL